MKGQKDLRNGKMRSSDVKQLFHFVVSSQNEVIFRDVEDFNFALNAIAISAFQTDIMVWADSIMPTHLHLINQGSTMWSFAKLFKISYIKRFNHKYCREGGFGECGYFCLPLDGVRHTIAAISYVLRNGLHHGQSATAFGYPYSSINSYFSEDLGKFENNSGKVITSRKEIESFLPRRADFPDSYAMDSNGVFLRKSFEQIKLVENYFVSPRSFLFYMDRRSDEKWNNEQLEDGNGYPPITLDLIEKSSSDVPIGDMLSNEFGKNFNKGKTDLDLCGLIDNYYVPEAHCRSVYQLSDSQKKMIARELWKEHGYRNEKQIRRCLVMCRK